MERAQRDLIGVLLTHLCELGLISKTVCSHAMEQIHSMPELPESFWNLAYPEEADGNECTPRPQ